MNTPIVDFVKKYADSKAVRLHMPGHKGKSFLGVEPFDITEINGADVLSDAKGIISKSEQNAAKLFGSKSTFYSTEGSSLVIKTMLSLIFANKKGDRCRILAARNVHKSFVYGCALCDIDVTWLYPKRSEHLCSCFVTAEDLKEVLDGSFDAVYVTSPDYLGNSLDIKAMARVCDEFDVPLLVDNAHGAYLAFKEENQHPIALGASMCADSAHKTLPVLTGGAYLHIAQKYSADEQTVRSMMSAFGSTSPSYLILQSLDLCNRYLADGDYYERLKSTVNDVAALRQKLEACGFAFYGDEALKLTVDCAKFGYSGDAVAEILRQHGIEIEYADSRFAVMMFTPENSEGDFSKLYDTMCQIPKKAALIRGEHLPIKHENAVSIRNAVFSPTETVPLNKAAGRICGAPVVSCPPAVPVVVSGEVITEKTVEVLKFYGIEEIAVVK